MLGKQYAELRGKITNQRVLDAEGPTIEISISAKGGKERSTSTGNSNLYGYTDSRKRSNSWYSKGRSNDDDSRAVEPADCRSDEAGELEMISYTGEAIGRPASSGNIKWRGVVFYKTSSGGKLAFLYNRVGVFEAETDTDGNFSDKTWEWK
jgi:hypothetical protein